MHYKYEDQMHQKLVFAIVCVNFLCCPTSIAYSFLAFSCDKFGAESFLRYDYSIDCSTSSFALSVNFARVGALINTVGVTIFFLVLPLYMNKQRKKGYSVSSLK